MRLLSLIASALLIAALVGCGGGGGGGGGSDLPSTNDSFAAGHWSGQMPTVPDPSMVDIDISSTGRISGSAFCFLDQYTVSGTVGNDGVISLTFSPGGPTLRGNAYLQTDAESGKVKLQGRLDQVEGGSTIATWDFWLNMM